MQWKLVRDQVAGATGKVAELHRTVAELKDFVETHKKETLAAGDRARLEMQSTVEIAREAGKGDLMQLAERLNAVSQLLAKERGVREVATQGVEKQVQGVRDALETDKTLRRKELSTMSSLVDDCKKALEAEGRSRERFEDRYAQDAHTLNDRLEAMSRQQAEESQDQTQLYKTMRHEVEQSLQACNRQLTQATSEMEQVASEARASVQTLEDRMGVIETRLGESASRQAAKFDLINERSDKVARALEEARMGEKRQIGVAESLAGKIQELEVGMKLTESETRDLCLRERQAREHSLRSTQMALVAKQEGELSDLEQKFLLRRDRDIDAMSERMGSVAASPQRARLDASHASIRVMSPPQRVMSNPHFTSQVVAGSPPPRGPVPVPVQAQPGMVTASMPAGWWGGKGGRAR